MKRQPIMADRFLAAKLQHRMLLDDKTQLRVRNYLYDAKRFVLDIDAARYVGQIVRENPAWIARNLEFALAPFPTTYIEIPFLAFYAETTNRMPDKTSDVTVAYLVRGPQVYVITDGETTDKDVAEGPILMPWFYTLNQPLSPEEEQQMCDAMSISRAGMDTFYWGEAWPKLSDDERRSLRAQHGMRPMNPQWLASEYSRKLWANAYDTSAGDVRNIVVLLLALNRGSEYTYEEQHGPHRAFIRNKPRTFLAHSVIKFPLNPLPQLFRGTGTGGAWRREHDVMAHFCHDEKARLAQRAGGSCEKDPWGQPTHAWNEVTKDKYGAKLKRDQQWRCLKCDGLKWRRKECKRGTREKGRVKTTYEVIKGSEHHATA